MPKIIVPSDPDDDSPADRYILLSRIGAGGMGETYRAWDKREGRPVVIKRPKRLLIQTPGFLERFDREWRTMQHFDHPHIVPITDVGVLDGLPYFAMPFLPGGSLASRRLRDDQGQTVPNPPGMLLLWLPQVAAALDHLHTRGVVHRDVKPHNIFFDVLWNAAVGDFGIAKVVEETGGIDKEQTLTGAMSTLGTVEYMPPERFRQHAQPDGFGDQYSLAITVYEMLTGRRPFTGDQVQAMFAIANTPPPPLNHLVPELPAALVQAVHRGLAKRPQERFASCTEFARAALSSVAPLMEDTGIARLACPKCDQIIKISTTDAGRSGACPKCSKRLLIAEDLSALWTRSEQAVIAAAAAGQQLAEPSDASTPPEAWEPPEAFDFKPLSKPTPVKLQRKAKQQEEKRAIQITAGVVAAIAVIGLATWLLWPDPLPWFKKGAPIDLTDEKVAVAVGFCPIAGPGAKRPQLKFERSYSGDRKVLVEFRSNQGLLPWARVYNSDCAPPGQVVKLQGVGSGRKGRLYSGRPTQSFVTNPSGKHADIKTMGLDSNKLWELKCVVKVDGRSFTVAVLSKDGTEEREEAKELCIAMASWLKPPDKAKKPRSAKAGS